MWQSFSSRSGGYSHIKQTGVLIVSLRGVNFRCLVLLRVFRAKTQYFKTSRSHLGLYTKKKRKVNYFFLVFVVSFGVHKNLEPHPNWSPLGRGLIQNFQQACFMWESPPPQAAVSINDYQECISISWKQFQSVYYPKFFISHIPSWYPPPSFIFEIRDWKMLTLQFFNLNEYYEIEKRCSCIFVKWWLTD